MPNEQKTIEEVLIELDAANTQLAKDAAASIRNLIATINEYKRELEKVWEAIDNIGKLK